MKRTKILITTLMKIKKEMAFFIVTEKCITTSRKFKKNTIMKNYG